MCPGQIFKAAGPLENDLHIHVLQIRIFQYNHAISRFFLLSYFESSHPSSRAAYASQSCAVVNMWGEKILFLFIRKRNFFWITFQDKPLEDILTF